MTPEQAAAVERLSGVEEPEYDMTTLYNGGAADIHIVLDALAEAKKLAGQWQNVAAGLKASRDERDARIARLEEALREARDWMQQSYDYESLSPAGFAITRDRIAAAGAALAGQEARR